MGEFLRFTFSGFWHFVGVLFLVSAVCSGISSIILALRGKADV